MITYTAAASALEKAARGCVWVCVCVDAETVDALTCFCGFSAGRQQGGQRREIRVLL